MTTPSIAPDAALAWRLGRHFLTGAGAGSVDEVVDALVAVPATPTGFGDPELSTLLRLAGDSEPGVLAGAVADGRLIKTFAFRGATHLMTPAQAAVHLALRCAGRQWELASWRSHYRLQPDDWPALRALIRDAAADGPVTWAGLAAAVGAEPRFAHLAAEFEASNWTLLKPFMWQGDLCFGPTVDGQPTFQLLAANPRWPGLMPLEQAGPLAVLAYLDGYGPASADRLQYWLGEGLSAGRKRITGWLGALVGDRVVQVEVAGRVAFLTRPRLAEIRAARPDSSVLLLPGYDQWVLGRGTADDSVVPPVLRPAATRGANLVLVGGRVAGTWRRTSSTIECTWPEGAEQSHSSSAPPAGLPAAVQRLADVTGAPLRC